MSTREDDFDTTDPEEADALCLADTIARLAGEQDVIPTGFAPLDEMLRGGGMPPGRILSIGGPPGSGKTTLATMILNSMSPHAPGVGLFADEGRDSAAVKLGQQLGYKREDLERGAPELIRWIRERMDGTYLLPDPDSPLASVTMCVKVAEQFDGAGDRPRLLVLDSVQTIPLDGKQEEDPDDRMAISQFCTVTQREIRIRKWIGILTAQANYESFKHKSESKNLNPLAAFAGSRALVYASDVCLVFGIPNDEDVAKVYVPKNRLGKKGSFAVKLNRETATLERVDTSELVSQEEREKEVAALDRTKRVKGKLLEKLAKVPGQTSTQLAEMTSTRKATVLRAIEELVDEGKIRATPQPRRSFVYDLA